MNNMPDNIYAQQSTTNDGFGGYGPVAIRGDTCYVRADLPIHATQLLTDLVNQISKTSPVDDHGHNLKMNMAYIKAVEFLDKKAPT